MAKRLARNTSQRADVIVRRMANTQIYIRGISEELAARLDAFADANALNGRSAAAKFLLNKALISEGYGAAVTPETTAQAATR